jgi:cell division septum initiation protein DivIVA
MATVTTDKYVNELVELVRRLERERDELIRQRKDLKRFMDIDKEKGELAFLRSEKEKLLDTASAEAEAIKEKARKSADRVMDNGNENARIELEKAKKITEQVELKLKMATEHADVFLKKQEALKRIEAEAIEREKRLLLRETRIGDFVERMKETLASL